MNWGLRCRSRMDWSNLSDAPCRNAWQSRAVPDIETVLATMRVPFCVASSGTHEKMRTTLGITGLLPQFRGKMYSVTEVARSKPFPDVFLYAANQQGVIPSACAVIEDTPTGVAAGVAAGMTVFGYCALTPRQRLIEAGAQHAFERMRDLPGLLRWPDSANQEISAGSSSSRR